MNMLLRFISLLAVALLIGCAGTPTEREPASTVAEWPEFPALQADEILYQIDPDASVILIRVDPEGPMARLGHSHIIGGAVVSGRVVTGSNSANARLDLKIDTTLLEVDKPEWRRAEGLEPVLDADAIEGTRSNMRGEQVLDVAQHPEIRIRSTAVRGPDWMPVVTARIRLRDVVREVEVPVAVVRSGQRLQAIGRFELLQSDFGIEPFSAAGGTLRVSDRMQIRFRITARARPE